MRFTGPIPRISFYVLAFRKDCRYILKMHRQTNGGQIVIKINENNDAVVIMNEIHLQLFRILYSFTDLTPKNHHLIDDNRPLRTCIPNCFQLYGNFY